ncbi:BCL-6 corepressor-like protein 1 isoform X3 [Esox lucius]|uniref:BCL-6 corepressor-like protein 1 isoform X2 n=1 Tax=Esox lucius TaxID=8010 RepID=UPI001476A0BC|nr:BCL-6 corepressor-like protein 1 isoform X2 [Esox lucius]XP_028975235.2 BCL-6 corepressor-like protein 1 isoform X3 [Esox lucius]
MQVDPSPVNVGDGGMVSKEIGAVSMVGNPPQTLPPELRRDVPLVQPNRTTTADDCRTPVNVCSDQSKFNHCPVVPACQQLNNAPASGPPLVSTDQRTDNKPEVPKPKVDGAGAFLTHQWPCGTTVSPEDPVKPSHGSVTSGQKPHAQTQSLISLPAGFQCSTLFKPGQPVTFLPSTNFSSSLCKITLPPALGQIAALREATASQFQKESQPQSVAAGVTPLLRTYPYHFSTGRCPAPEKKNPTPKLRCNSTFSNKSSKGEHTSAASTGVAAPAIAIPVQHPALGSAPPTRFTLSPAATLCCGPALAGITTQARLQNRVEKGPPRHCIADKTSVGFLKLQGPSAADDRAVVSPAEPRDVPLDLSAKSKRPKTTVKGPPNPVATAELLHNEGRQKGSLHPKRSQIGSYGSAAPYPILPNTHRNGTHPKPTSRPLNHQGLEPNSSWVRGSSQGSINNLPGTYVGVASPILASTLRSKDGKGSFEDEFQTFARQETISIIDQGEQLASRGKKASFMTKGNQHVHGIKHPTSTSPAVTQSCPSKGAFATALPGSANSYSQQKSGTIKAATQYPPAVIKPLWQQPALLPHQGASVQRKVGPGTFKVKGAPGSEDPISQIARQSPSRMEDEKWDRTKSPLSNLESIVKQKALETTALTGEGYRHMATVASRRPEAVNYQPTGHDTLFPQTAAFGCPPYRSMENKERPSSHSESTLVMNKLDKLCVSEPKEKSTEKYMKLGELADGKDSQVSAKSASNTHAFGSIGSCARYSMDSKLAQELEGGIMKEESSSHFGLSPRAKLEGIALSILAGQSPGVVELEKPIGTKEESPKAKPVVSKQKKPLSPRKPAKEKSLLELSKKAVVPGKKKQDQEIPPGKKEPKNKKPHSTALEPNVSVAESTPHSEDGKRVSVAKSTPHSEDGKRVSVAESTTHSEDGKRVSVAKSTPHSEEEKRVSVAKSTPHSEEEKRVSVAKSTPHSEERKRVSVAKSTPHSEDGKRVSVAKSTPHSEDGKRVSVAKSTPHSEDGKRVSVAESTPHSEEEKRVSVAKSTPHSEDRKSVSVAKSTPHSEERKSTRREKSSHPESEAVHYKPGTSGTLLPNPLSLETSGSIRSPGRTGQELASSDGSTPRLRRCRRRGDEARLENWGFTTPSPPPPLSPPHPASPPPQPARRPRGRPRTNPLPEKADRFKTRTAPSTEGDNPTRRKRTRCRSKKYQNGEYIMEKAKDQNGEYIMEKAKDQNGEYIMEKAKDQNGEYIMEKAKDRGGEGEGREVPPRHGTPAGSDLRTGLYPRLSATLTSRGTSPEPGPKRPLFGRSGSVRQSENNTSPDPSDKPSGKRKFKSKHLSDTDEPKKLKSKRCVLGKHPASAATDDNSPDAKKPAGLLAAAKSSSSPPASKKGTSGRGGAPESPRSRPVPPEVRRLIVNKNAGETLLQRAARLGYQEVVLYCLEKDIREVNRRDNAGYTALHEACSRGWSHIVQVLLKHGADVNCSAQDGTRPIHDAVASDNLPVVWMLLNHGADPNLATYSGQTAVKLAQSPGMKTFLREYFTDLQGRNDQDLSVPWDFYSSSVFETGQEACWDFLLSQRGEEEEEDDKTRAGREERDSDMDCLLFEFSSDPLLPCYHVQVSLTQGFCNWFLLTDVLKRLKMSSRIFRARYPHLEVVSLAQAELWRQVSVSQVSLVSARPPENELQEGEGLVELVRCVPELQGLLGSSIHILREDEEDDEGDRTDTATPCSR